MPDLPSHPESDDTGISPRLRESSGRPSWRLVAGAATVIALIVVFVVLHLSGVVGPSEH